METLKLQLCSIELLLEIQVEIPEGMPVTKITRFLGTVAVRTNGLLKMDLVGVLEEKEVDMDMKTRIHTAVHRGQRFLDLRILHTNILLHLIKVMLR